MRYELASVARLLPYRHELHGDMSKRNAGNDEVACTVRDHSRPGVRMTMDPCNTGLYVWCLRER